MPDLLPFKTLKKWFLWRENAASNFAIFSAFLVLLSIFGVLSRERERETWRKNLTWANVWVCLIIYHPLHRRRRWRRSHPLSASIFAVLSQFLFSLLLAEIDQTLLMLQWFNFRFYFCFTYFLSLFFFFLSSCSLLLLLLKYKLCILLSGKKILIY